MLKWEYVPLSEHLGTCGANTS